jgi:nodulation protein E
MWRRKQRIICRENLLASVHRGIAACRWAGVSRRVAITGIGAVSAFGMTAAALWDGMREGRCAIREIHNIPTEGLTNKIAAEVDGYVQADHFTSKQCAMLDKVSQIAVVSAREAMAQAGLSADDVKAAGRRIGVIHGASPGQITLDEGYKALYAENVRRLHPFSLPRIMGAGPSAAISIDLGAHGPCFGTASACSTASHAIGLGFDMIRAGRLDVAVAGGADSSIVFGYVKCWEALRLLAPDAARPFSRDRTGIVLGEGAATVVMEAWDHAQARGATILAEVLGFGMASDAVDMVAPDPESAAAAMLDAIADAGLVPADIGYVNAHGTGTRINDRAEVAALHRVFGSAVPPTSSLKSQTGHTLNAAGGMETVATVLALRGQLMPATLGFREFDPECDIDCVPNAPREAHFEFAMSNSLGFGGLNAILILRRVN